MPSGAATRQTARTTGGEEGHYTGMVCGVGEQLVPADQ